MHKRCHISNNMNDKNKRTHTRHCHISNTHNNCKSHTHYSMLRLPPLSGVAGALHTHTHTPRHTHTLVRGNAQPHSARPPRLQVVPVGHGAVAGEVSKRHAEGADGPVGTRRGPVRRAQQQRARARANGGAPDVQCEGLRVTI